MTAVAAQPAEFREGLRRALTYSSVGTAGARLTGAFGGLLVARLLGPAGRGQYAILVLVGTAGSLALAAGMQFSIARGAAQHGAAAVRWLVRAHVAVIAVAATVGGLFLVRSIGSLADVGTVVSWLTVAFAATSAIQLVWLALPNGVRAMGVVATATIVAGLVYVGVALALVVLDEQSLSLVLAGGVAGNIVSLVVLAIWGAHRRTDGAPGLRDPHAYRQAFRFGLPAGIAELVLLAMFRIDVLIVAAFLPLRDVGLYAVATALTEILWVVPDAVAQVVLPTSARTPDAARTRRLLVASTMVTAVAGAALVIVDGRVVELLFGARFDGATSAVPLLALAAVVVGVWKIVGAEVVARGHSTPRLVSSLAGLAGMVAVDLVAVPQWGIVGAALGSLCGYAIASLVVTHAWVAQDHVPSGVAAP